MHLNAPYLKARMTSIVKWGLLSIAYLIIFIALLSSVFRAFTPMVGRYQPQLEQAVSLFIGQPVHIESIETGWYWFKPILKANHVVIDLPEHQQIKINQLQIGIDLFSSLLHFRVQPGLLLIDGMALRLNEIEGGWQIQGVSLQPHAKTNPDELERLLSIILEHQTIQVRHIQLTIQFNTLPTLTLQDIDATLISVLGKHRLRGRVKIDSLSKMPVEFGAEVVLNAMSPQQLFGHMYLGVEQLNLVSLLTYFPNTPVTLNNGMLGAQIWGDLTDGRFIAGQVRFNLEQLMWKKTPFTEAGHFKWLKGHLAWNRTKTGFQVTGDELAVSDAHTDWPQTAFALDFNEQNRDWDFYIKRLDISSVLGLPFKTSLPMFSHLQTAQRAHVSGMLSDTHLVQQQGQYHILTQFTDLSWQMTDAWPGVKHLSGVINWEPSSGHLKLQSQDVSVALRSRQPMLFSMINTDLVWKSQEDIWSFDLLNMAIDNSHLKLNAQGKLEQVSAGHPGRIDLKAEFALNDGTYWMKFLPQKSLKPKLYQWLSHDIHAINNGVGSMLVQGDLADFPFDDEKGRFHIETTLNGVNLNFAKGWSAAEEIHAQLQVNQRQLSTHILDAKIGGVAVGPIYLTVNDLGLDKERLLIHGLAKAPATLAWPIVLAAPLGQNNPFLSKIHWRGPVELDLQLDIPLFPGDDEILALGEAKLLNNQIDLKQPSVFSIGFKQVKGLLRFDSHGLLPTRLHTTLWGHPVPVELTGKQVPHRVTRLHLKTPVTMSDLFKVFDQTPPEGMTGRIQLDSQLLLSSTEKTLTLKSQLQGLKIDFPPWIQKKKKEEKQLEATFFFASQPTFTAMIRYADELQLKRTEKGAWDIHTTLPMLHAQMRYQPEGRHLSGVIESLYFPEKSATTSSSSWNINPSDLPTVDLQIKKLHYGNLSLGELSMKAKPIGKTWQVTSWSLHSPTESTQGTASWTKTATKQTSHLTFDFESKDINQSLNAWHMNPVLEKGAMQLHAALSWNDALWKTKLVKMRGKITTKVTEGRTINFGAQTESKLGLAKLLSVFSLQTLPRRLKLDFSDLSHTGYTFDKFEGAFQLGKGMLQTDTCIIDGPVAAVDIQGRIDVVQQLYDLSVRVSPHITSSLPVVAMIAGGPIAGVATLVASNILKGSVQKMTSYTYRVTGPWKDPVIEPFQLYRGKE